MYQYQACRERHQENIPIQNSLKKYLGVNLTKDVRVLVNENGKTHKGKKLRKILEVANISHSHGLEEFDIVRNDFFTRSNLESQ